MGIDEKIEKHMKPKKIKVSDKFIDEIARAANIDRGIDMKKDIMMRSIIDATYNKAYDNGYWDGYENGKDVWKKIMKGGYNATTTTK